MAKQYIRAGITTWKGETKIRFGNQDRTSIMVKEGQTDINMLQLSETPLDKRDLVLLMKDHEKFQDEVSQRLVAEFLGSVAKAEERAQSKADGTAKPRGRKPKAESADEAAIAQAVAKKQQEEEVA